MTKSHLVFLIAFLLPTALQANEKYRDSLPPWSVFRLQSEPKRKHIEPHIISILQAIEKNPVVGTKNRFCVVGGAPLEVGLREACTLGKEESQVWSDRSCLFRSTDAKKGRECRDSRLQFVASSPNYGIAWLRLNRAVASYCGSKRSDAKSTCKKIAEFGASVDMPAPLPQRPLSPKPTKSASSEIFFGLLMPRVLASETCVVRDGVLETPSGRKFYLDYGRHSLGDELDELFDAMATDSDSANVRSLVKSTLEKNSGTWADRQKRAARIEDFATKYDVNWFGVEAAPNEMISANARRSNNLYFDSILRQNLVADDDIRQIQAIGGSFGGVGYVWDTNPKFQQSVSFVALEDDAAKATGLGIAERFRELDDREKTLVRQNELDASGREKIKTKVLDVMYGLRPLTRSEVDSFVAQFTSPQQARFARDYLETANRFKINSEDRETAVVQTMWAQPGNGVVSFGEAHAATMNQKLIATCIRERDSRSGSSPTSR